MTNKNFENYLKEIRNNIPNIYNQFYIWKGLQNKDYQKVYNRDKYFWSAVIYSLENSFFLDLVKLFENKEDVISIYSLLNFVLSSRQRRKIEQKIYPYKNILDKLWKWRCKIFAHKDRQVLLNLKKFYKDYPIKYEEIENLLNLAKELLENIESAVSGKKHSYNYEFLKEESQIDIENIISKLNQ